MRPDDMSPLKQELDEGHNLDQTASALEWRSQHILERQSNRVVAELFESSLPKMVSVLIGIKSGFFELLDQAPDGLTVERAVDTLNSSARQSFGHALLDPLSDHGIVVRDEARILPTEASKSLTPGGIARSTIDFLSTCVLLPVLAGIVACPESKSSRTYFQDYHNTDKNLFAYMDQAENARARRDFHKTMASLASDPRNSPEEVLRQFDWTRIETILDVGGSKGHVCRMIANIPTAKHCHFIVQDLRHVISEAHKELEERADDDIDLTFQERDFFNTDSTPSDVILLSRILHDWDDENAREILGKVTANMRRGQKLLILDAISDRLVKSRDAAINNSIVVTTLSGGHERVNSEWDALIADANPRLEIISKRIPQRSMVCMIEVGLRPEHD